jgi:hypothetical protein
LSERALLLPLAHSLCARKAAKSHKTLALALRETRARRPGVASAPPPFPGSCPLGIAFDTISTTKGEDIAPVKYTMGRDFSGARNTHGVAGLLSAMVRSYQLRETKSFVVRVSDVTDVNGDGAADAGDQIQYQWKFSTQESFSAPVSLLTAAGAIACTPTSPCELTSNGAGTAATGVFVYVPSTVAANDLFPGAATGLEEGNLFEFTYDYQEGRPYKHGDANSAHQEVECSGRGSCDSASGRCECFDGFTGEACQRTVCPNDCSGHGVCQDQRRFAADADTLSAYTLSYTGAYDAFKQMGCMCDDGFRGPDCSMVECPSGADPMGHYGGDGLDADDAAGPAMDCSGRGLCDYTAGQCQCFKGFYGERCEHQTNFV